MPTERKNVQITSKNIVELELQPFKSQILRLSRSLSRVLMVLGLTDLEDNPLEVFSWNVRQFEAR